MKNGIVLRLAFAGIRKNYRFFIPRILAETGLLACFYIVLTLACDRRLAEVKGGNFLPTFMWMGVVIIGILSFVLMLYTGSFLMKQRKKEFGLYSVLGMEKKHICRVLLGESLICSAVSVGLGLLSGALIYKLCSLAICRILKADIVAGFYYLTAETLIPSGLIFCGIDAAVFGVGSVDILRMKPVELMTAAAAGEKEPKVKWPLLIAGLLTLGSGYYLSLTTRNPLKALLLFFAAVMLVIAGTYCLYIAGSVFVLKTLKRREKFYYRPGPITAVSGLLYRMKKNAVGLASVAILATGVLVMTSSTLCLYSAAENVLKANYPQDCYLSTVFYDDDGNRHIIPEEPMRSIAEESAARNGLEIRESAVQEFFDVTLRHESGSLSADTGYSDEGMDFSSLYNITFITESTYVELGGEPLGLSADEVAVCPYRPGDRFEEREFTLFGGRYRVKEELTFFPIGNAVITVNCFGMVVADENVLYTLFDGQRESYGANASELSRRLCLNFDSRSAAMEKGSGFWADVQRAAGAYIESEGYESYRMGLSESVWEARERLYGMYGTLLFLGILLGIVCLFATVLIIYYKQIAEGYEDRQRFQIMRRIGMTGQEVKMTIRTQTLLVFFLPLATAGIHIAFAFPILTRLMTVLLMDDAWRFAKWCLIVYLVFSSVYALIYKLTAKTYYKIVY